MCQPLSPPSVTWSAVPDQPWRRSSDVTKASAECGTLQLASPHVTPPSTVPGYASQ